MVIFIGHSVIPTLGRLKQESCYESEFEATVDYVVSRPVCITELETLSQKGKTTTTTITFFCYSKNTNILWSGEKSKYMVKAAIRGGEGVRNRER